MVLPAMSTIDEKIAAQRAAFESQPTQWWHRHLIGPAELEILLHGQQRTSQGIGEPLNVAGIAGEHGQMPGWVAGGTGREGETIAEEIRRISGSAYC
jgi:hypothetical protein